MAKNIKLKPGQPMRHYLGIDVTKALDTVAWGHLWNATFGWRNLLWDLDKDSSDIQRRIDKAHPKLPIARLIRTHKTTGKDKKEVTNTFADTCLLPQGVDAKGTDKLWAGADALANLADIDAASAFMQTLILNPRVEKTTSELKSSGTGTVGDIVYISSHGSSDGNMSGDVDLADRIFSPGRLAAGGATFSGPGWILLSNCNTLKPCTHLDWITLMTGSTPLRGIVGFQDLCPLAPGSADVFASFIRRLSNGKTFVRAWEEALKARGLEERWIVLCHEQAAGDTISDWNADKLTPLPASPKILMFNKANAAGVEVKPTPDPFEAFWSKGGIRITGFNQEDPGNALATGNTVVITVKPTPPAAAFTDGVTISITLIYIRPNYPAPIDVTKMFTVTGQSGASTPATANLNPQSPGRDDSWQLTTTGTPSEVTLTLRCDDLSALPHRNYPLWLRVDNSAGTHDFTCGGAILIA